MNNLSFWDFLIRVEVIVGGLILGAAWWTIRKFHGLDRRVLLVEDSLPYIRESIEKMRNESSEQHKELAEKVDKLNDELVDLKGYLRGKERIQK